MNKAAKTVGITIFGLVTSMLTAVILFLLEAFAHFAVYSFMLWFIIPVGAIAAGFVAASGYYIGGRLMQYRPDRILFFNVIVVSVLTFVALNFLLYIFSTINGRAVAEMMSFPQYLHESITNLQMTMGRSSSSTPLSLGVMGYGIVALQIVGFAVGGLIVYGMLDSVPHCDRCLRYLDKVAKQVRSSADAGEFQTSLKRVKEEIEAGSLANAIAEHRVSGAEKMQKDHQLRSFLRIERCKQCGRHWLDHQAEFKHIGARGSADWALVPELKARNVTDAELSF